MLTRILIWVMVGIAIGLVVIPVAAAAQAEMFDGKILTVSADKHLTIQQADDQRTFVVNYRLVGALRIAEAGDQLYMAAIRSGRAGPVQASRITVRLPQAVSPSERLRTGTRSRRRLAKAAAANVPVPSSVPTSEVQIGNAVK